MGDKSKKKMGGDGGGGGAAVNPSDVQGTGLYDFINNDHIEIVTKPGTATDAPERLRMKMIGRDNGDFVFQVTPENADILRQTTYRHMSERDWNATRDKILSSKTPVHVSMSPKELQAIARDTTIQRNHNGRRWTVDPNAAQAMTQREGRPFKNVAKGGTGANRRGQEQESPYKGTQPIRPNREQKESPIKNPQRPRISGRTSDEAAASLRGTAKRVTARQKRQANERAKESRQAYNRERKEVALQSVKQDKQQAARDKRNARWRAERAEARLASEREAHRALKREEKNAKRRVSAKANAEHVERVQAEARKQAIRIEAKKAAAKQARQDQRDAEKRLQQARVKEQKVRKNQL